MSHYSSQASEEVIWGVARTQNAYLVKRKQSGGINFSRDPLNLANIHSRKHAGFLREKAVGVISAGEKGGVTLLTKKSKSTQKPATLIVKATFGGNKSNRKTYKGVASTVAKNGYRADLLSTAVSRASAIRLSQRTPKDTPEVKLRGAKATKAAAEKDE